MDNYTENVDEWKGRKHKLRQIRHKLHISSGEGK